MTQRVKKSVSLFAALMTSLAVQVICDDCGFTQDCSEGGPAYNTSVTWPRGVSDSLIKSCRFSLNYMDPVMSAISIVDISTKIWAKQLRHFKGTD